MKNTFIIYVNLVNVKRNMGVPVLQVRRELNMLKEATLLLDL